MQKIVCIVGPTGVGKTDLAFKLARKFDGELVSADSIQVYRGLDIISGKDLPEGYTFKNGYYSSNGGPSIYLLDVVEPTSSFNVSEFYKESKKTISEILQKGKIPIVVGGTGLYVQSLLKGLDEHEKPNLKLREQLRKLSINELQSKLIKINQQILEEMNESDRKNPRRLIRKIEILSSQLQVHKNEKTTRFDSMVIGLTCDRQSLKKRIDERVKKRLKNGALKEAERLFVRYDNLTQQAKDANGYKHLFAYLKNEIILDEAIYRWKISEYRHAKNQMTWFRKYGNVEWFDVNTPEVTKQIENKIEHFLHH